MNLVGMREYARHRQVSLTTVQQWIHEGKLEGALKTTANGKDRTRTKIFLEKADELIGDHKFPESVDHKGEVARSNGSLVTARTAKTAIDAQLAKLKLDQLSGKLVDKSKVIEVAKITGRLTRESLMTLPDRLSPILAGENDINEIRKILTKEINDALRNMDISNYNFFKDESDGIG